MKVIYVEAHLQQHPRVEAILAKQPNATVVVCDHYGEIFNRKNQNFRWQKQQPALILAEKTGRKVLPTPEGFGIGGAQNYYFSHMQNCLYDCRYCFLQGMYPSAHHLLFVNYEDFMTDITEMCEGQSESSYFFSGYDCDSLALEPQTGFLKSFLPFFAKLPQAILECRTKSTNVRPFLNHQPFANCVIAFSFTPTEISQVVEHGVPSVEKRINAMASLAQAGWLVGLRFDPLIHHPNFTECYQRLIADIFRQLPADALHSVSVGPLRFPEKMFQKIVAQYPEDAMLAGPLVKRDKQRSYSESREADMKSIVLELLAQYVAPSLIFECQPQ